MKLSKKLARLKAENGLTTEALSQKSGVPRGTLNKLLNGETRNPTIGTLKALAGALASEDDSQRTPLERELAIWEEVCSCLQR